jgi:pentatricopeptide repeat protein
MKDKTYYHRLLDAYNLKKAGKFSEAIKLYEKMLEEHNDPRIMYAIASCYLAHFEDDVNEYDGLHVALNWLQKTMELSPQDAESFYLAGYICSLWLPYREMAITYLKKALHINPNHLPALSAAASLYGIPENVVTLDEAIEWRERAQTLDPTNPDRSLNLMNLYMEAQRISDAKGAYETALTRRDTAKSSDIFFKNFLNKIIK